VEGLLTAGSLNEQEVENDGMSQDSASSQELLNGHILAPPLERVPGDGAGRRLIWQGLLIVGIMAAIAFCEYVFAYKNVAYGIIISLVLVVILYTLLTVSPLSDELASCIESITLVPMYILFTSSLPWFFVHQYFLLPAVYSCVLALCCVHIYQKQLDLKQIFGAIPGGRQIAWLIPAGTLIGVSLGFVEYVILRPAPTYGHVTAMEIVVNLLYMLFFVGLGEELLFRGFIQSDLSRLFGWRWGLVLASVLFSIMHLTWRSVPELFFVLLAGFVFGSLYLKTRGLYLSILVHCMNNVVLVAVYPYLVGASFSVRIQALIWQWLTSINTSTFIYLFRR
jgi:membrane protease YdiL (CAAX protease family)